MVVPKFYARIGTMEFSCPFKMADWSIRYLSSEQLKGVRMVIKRYGEELIEAECYELMPEMTILIEEIEECIT